MKKIILASAILLFLTGCAAQMTADNEKELVNDALKSIAEKCSQYGDVKTGMPKSRKAALKYHYCEEEIVKDAVIPKSSFPDIWLNVEAEDLLLSKQYHDGKIDRDTLHAMMDKKTAEFSLQLQQRLGVIQQQQNAALQQSLQNFQQQQQAAAIQRANSMPHTTNCSMFANTMNCTSW
ncbi:MAG: hypothetical protein GC185_09545 [Alphaproteobacteria bacterium]|nr:hypothetical protein [Alphaproteobacteria bacterium]